MSFDKMWIDPFDAVSDEFGEFEPMSDSGFEPMSSSDKELWVFCVISDEELWVFTNMLYNRLLKRAARRAARKKIMST